MRRFIKMCFLVLFFSFILNIDSVNAVVTSYTEGVGGLTSVTCKSGICVSSYGYKFSNYYDFTNTAIYGVRITIVDGNNYNKTISKNFWATQNMADAMNGGILLANGQIPNSVYKAGIGLPYSGLEKMDVEGSRTYSSYIAGLGETEVRNIIDAMGMSPEEAYDYYIKFEPIYVIRFTCSGYRDSSCDNDVYFIGGTTEDILCYGYGGNYQTMCVGYASSLGNEAIWQFKKVTRDAYAYNYGGNKPDTLNVWNVIKNYALSTYVTEKPSGSNLPIYTGNNIPALKENKNSNVDYINQLFLYDNYAGLGVGYIKISEKVKPTCQSQFVDNPIERIKLYKTWGHKNLLNFDIHDAATACSDPVDGTCDNSVGLGCLSASSSTSFGDNNLSCFKEETNINGHNVFCGYTFDIRNNLSDKTQFSFTANYKFPVVSKSGQLYFSRTLSDKVIAKQTIVKTCYSTGAIATNNLISNDYGSFVDNLSFNNLKLDITETTSPWIEETVVNFKKYTQTYTAEYSLLPVYSKKGSGELSYEVPQNTNKYKFLGYGLISKLNENISSGLIGIPFSFDITLDGAIINNNESETKFTENACVYDYKTNNQDIIKNGKLDLEFRIIDVNNPFPGKNATNRKVGSNWCDKDNCYVTCNRVVKGTIKGRNDSYNSGGQGPKYIIDLTPDDIKAIRGYNEYAPYDDYDLSCDENGENCVSTFIENLKNGYLSYQDEDGNSLYYATISSPLIENNISTEKELVDEETCNYVEEPETPIED